MRHDAESQVLTWVDIPAGTSYCRDADGEVRAQQHGKQVAFRVVLSDGSWIGGAEDGLTGSGLAECVRPHGLGTDEALNDGAVHPTGTCLVFGSRDRKEATPRGRMWIVGVRWVRPTIRFTVFNGPAFSPDGTLIYFTDSPTGVIWRAAFDPIEPMMGPAEVFARVPVSQGVPDGMVCDDDGCLWSAHWDGGCLTRYRPNGEVDRCIPLPVARATSLAFHGPKRDRLAVTTALPDDVAPTDLAKTDPAGQVLELAVDVSGPSSPRLSRSVVQTILGNQHHV
jgi:sugar lactone lactonase YvrE